MSWYFDEYLWIKKYCNIECKRSYFRCILYSISRDGAVNRLNNSVLENKGVLQMDFGANKTPGEIIGEVAFGGTYFNKTFILVLIESSTKCHKKNLISWKTLIKSFIV